MMKLVSYYEDKYKLTHEREPEQLITERITSVPLYFNKYNEIDRNDLRELPYNGYRRYNAPHSRRVCYYFLLMLIHAFIYQNKKFQLIHFEVSVLV